MSGVGDEDFGTFRLEADVDCAQAAAAQLLVHGKGWQQGDAESRDGGIAHDQSVVHVQTVFWPHYCRFTRVRKAPVCAANDVEDGVPRLKLADRRGCTVLVEVSGRGDQYAPARAQPPYHQPAVAHAAVPHHRVEAFRRRIDGAVVQVKLEFDSRMRLEEGV